MTPDGKFTYQQGIDAVKTLMEFAAPGRGESLFDQAIYDELIQQKWGVMEIAREMLNRQTNGAYLRAVEAQR